MKAGTRKLMGTLKENRRLFKKSGVSRKTTAKSLRGTRSLAKLIKASHASNR